MSIGGPIKIIKKSFEVITEFFTKDIRIMLVSVLIVGLVIFGIGCYTNVHSGESGWVIALFVLPLLAQILCLFHFYSSYYQQYPDDNTIKVFYYFYLRTVGACLLSYCFLWICYCSDWGTTDTINLNQFFSFLALGFIVLLLIPVINMTRAIMKPPIGYGNELDNLSSGVTKMPFLALLLFFTVFIGIAYLFGFAFGFHNKSRSPENAPLYMPKLYSSKAIDSAEESKKPDNPQQESEPPQPQPAIKSISTADDTPQGATIIQGHIILYFEKGIANLQMFDHLGQSDQKKMNTAKRCEANHRSVQAIVQEITKRIKEDEGIRVIMKGGADETGFPDGKSYSSNYELSAARIENVKERILSELSKTMDKWSYIEWIFLPLSSEFANVLPQLQNGKETEPEDWKRVVAVEIKKVSQHPAFMQNAQNQELLKKINDLRKDIEKEQKRLNQNTPQPADISLMEYMYFSIYTITTTGYGDMVPRTAYAKFITSAANFCEVFFLVVFFSALLSSVKDARPAQHGVNNNVIKEEADSPLSTEGKT